jgi:hypothetical protein
MNKEQEELLSDAYNMFQKTCQFEKDANHILPDKWMTMSNDFMNAGILSQEEFTNKIKIDIEFAKQWGVFYEERELNLDERAKQHPTPDMFYDIHGSFSIGDSIENSNMSIEDRKWLHNKFDEGGIPKSTISITYNNKTIESYGKL